MRKIYLFALLSLVCGNLLAQNLFSNPGFESGADYWNFQVTSGDGVVNYEATDARTGTNAAEVSVVEAADENWHIQLNTPSWTSTEGNQYTMSFYAKADQDATIHVAVQSGAPNYEYITGFDANLSANEDWERFEVTYTTTASGDGAVNFNLYLGAASATYMFDDFMLEDVSVTNPPAPTVPTEGAYYTDVYRNLFKEWGKEDIEIDSKVEAAFQQIFYGNETSEKLYFETGDDMAYIKTIDTDDIRTEGLSYAMMICVQLDKKEEFDKIWKFSKTYSQHQSGPRAGYFAWQLEATPPFDIIDPNPASDGEEYFIMSLFFASHRWGDGEGIFDYSTEASEILHDMLHKEEDNGGVVENVTNMFNLEEKQIVFTPFGGAADYTDPSYHLPAFYELWSFWAEEDNDFWAAAADTSASYLSYAAHPQSGLVTDYMSFDGMPQTTDFNSNSVNFAYDSWRVAGNVGMYAHWFGGEEWALNFNNNILRFFNEQGPSYRSIYTYDGTVIEENNYHSAGHIAMNGAGVLAADEEETTWPFVAELWNMNIPTGEYRYYDGMLYMLSLLQASGNFRVFKPGAITSTSEVLSTSSSIVVYPNPGNDVKIKAPQDLNVVIVNNLGQTMFEGTVESWNTSNLTLQSGLYFLKSANDQSTKFVVK